MALKIFNEITSLTWKYYEREVHIQHYISHNNAIQLYGLSKTPEGRPVLIMELADYSLYDLIFKRDELNSMRRNPIMKPTLTEKVRMIKEIADFLVYFHSKQYIHRDLKVLEWVKYDIAREYISERRCDQSERFRVST